MPAKSSSGAGRALRRTGAVHRPIALVQTMRCSVGADLRPFRRDVPVRADVGSRYHGPQDRSCFCAISARRNTSVGELLAGRGKIAARIFRGTLRGVLSEHKYGGRRRARWQGLKWPKSLLCHTPKEILPPALCLRRHALPSRSSSAEAPAGARSSRVVTSLQQASSAASPSFVRLPKANGPPK